MEVDVKSPPPPLPAPSTPGPGRPKKHIYSVLALTFHALGFLLNFTTGTGIWPKIRLGNRIWAKFGLGYGIHTPLQDPQTRQRERDCTVDFNDHCIHKTPDWWEVDQLYNNKQAA